MLRAQRIEADLARGDAPQQIMVTMIGDVIDAFLSAAEAENRAPKTLSKYRFKTSEIQSLAEDRRVRYITQLNP